MANPADLPTPTTAEEAFDRVCMIDEAIRECYARIDGGLPTDLRKAVSDKIGALKDLRKATQILQHALENL